MQSDTLQVRFCGKYRNDRFKFYYRDSLLFDKKIKGIIDYEFTINVKDTLIPGDAVDIVVKRKHNYWSTYYDLLLAVQYIPTNEKLIIYRSARNKKKYMLNAIWGESAGACIIRWKFLGIQFQKYYHPY